MNIEEVTWVDSGTSWGNVWYDKSTLIDKADSWDGVSVTVGYPIYENDKVVMLAQTVDTDSEKVANVFLIYKACIIERRQLA